MFSKIWKKNNRFIMRRAWKILFSIHIKHYNTKIIASTADIKSSFYIGEVKGKIQIFVICILHDEWVVVAVVLILIFYVWYDFKWPTFDQIIVSFSFKIHSIFWKNKFCRNNWFFNSLAFAMNFNFHITFSSIFIQSKKFHSSYINFIILK